MVSLEGLLTVDERRTGRRVVEIMPLFLVLSKYFFIECLISIIGP